MARCGCSGATCSCLVQGSGNVTVSGAGSQSNPYIVSSNLNMQVADTSTIDFSITGDGSVGNPYILSGTSALDLDELLDVDVTSATTGQVLAKQSDGIWRAVAATTAPTGAINLLSTGGLLGDGSAGTPLGIKLAPSSGLTLSASGLALTSGGVAWTAFSPALTASTTNPAIGNGSIEATYQQLGKRVDVSYEVNIGSTTTRGVGLWRLALPVAPIASRHQVLAMQVVASGVADFVGVAKIEGLTRIERMHIATSTAAQAISHSVPSAFPAGSRIIISGSYEAA
jgi:hypothetical protein